MSSRSDKTRELLMAAGEDLFATNGVDNVTVAQITAAAGQRNGAAVHYHFGSRDGLLEAILERHLGRLDEDRSRRLHSLSAERSMADVMTIVVEPMAACLDTASGRAFLKIQSHRSRTAGGVLAEPSVAMAELREAIAELVPDVHPALGLERGRLVGLMISQRLGQRADEEAAGPVQPPRSAFVAAMVAAAVAVLADPTTP